jgi:tRNA-splicing ligase RtcB
MGAQSFIVSGKGAAASYCSCSHGAGRKMSRNTARRDLDAQLDAEADDGFGNVDRWLDPGLRCTPTT